MATENSDGTGSGVGAPQFLDLAGRRLAYRKRLATDRTRDCAGILFLPGFRSDMAGTKATFLDAFCAARELPYVRFDYTGHGASSGRFEDGTIGAWAADAIAVIDHVADGSLVLVGSSMGGWIMLLAALARPDRIAGLVGMAPAPDFTEALIWNRLTDEERDRLLSAGRLETPSAYADEPTIITRALIEEGREHLVAGRLGELRCPVRILHGMADPDVPWRLSLDLVEGLGSTDAEVTFVKAGDHRLSTPDDIRRLCDAVGELAAR